MFNDINVDRSLYGAETPQHFINWYARIGAAAGEAGFFFAGLDVFDSAPNGWEQREIALGSDPNLTSVYVTRRLRGVVLGVRKQSMITDEQGNRHTYPPFTRKTDRVEGKFSTRTQVAFLVAEQNGTDASSLRVVDTQVRILTANGMTKGLSWSNNQRSGFGANMDPGVEELLTKYMDDKAREAETGWLPWQCLLHITLQPQVTVRGERRIPLVINTGHGSSVNPFTVALEGNFAPVYVGGPLFEEYQELRRSQTIPWESEWQEAGTLALNDEFSGNVPVVEDDLDQIPF